MVGACAAVMWLAGCSPLGIIYLVYLLVARTTTLFVQINSLQLHSNELSSLISQGICCPCGRMTRIDRGIAFKRA